MLRQTLTIGLLALTASSAGAQGLQLITWTGDVDREVQIVLRGRSATTRDVGGNEPGASRIRVVNAVPRQDGSVIPQVAAGRGSVTVVQQPTATNNYTAVIRVRDPQAGTGRYRITAVWEGLSSGEVTMPNRGRGYGRRSRELTGGQLRWTGHVDDALRIYIRGASIQYRLINGKRTDDAQSSFVRSGGLPMIETDVSVQMNTGRGSVTVVQQPTAANGYTLVVDVRDPQSGYGFYDFDLRWYQ